MSTSNASRWRILASIFLALFLVGGPVVAPALADDRGSGEIELTVEQRQQAIKEIVPKVLDTVCRNSSFGTAVSMLGGEAPCKLIVAKALPKNFAGLKQFTDDITNGQFCQKVADNAGPLGFAVKPICDQATNKGNVLTEIRDTVQNWWKGFTDGIGAVVGFVNFVQNPASAIDSWANSLKKDSVNGLGTALNSLSVATDFNPGDPSFRAVWAAGAGIGLAVLAGMIIMTLRGAAKAEIDGKEATASIMKWAPLAVIAMVLGPVLGYIIMGWLQPINEGLIEWGSGPVNQMLKTANAFAGIGASPAFGPNLGIFLWGGLLIGAWSTFFMMVLWKAALILLGVGISVALGMFGNQRWRPRALKMVSTFGGILLSKPALLFLLAAGLRLTGMAQQTSGTVQGGVDQVVNVAVVMFILIMVTIFPVLLLKYMPIMPEGGSSSRSGGSPVGAAVMAGAGAGVGMMIANRRRDAMRNDSGGGGSSRGGDSKYSWTPKQEPTNLGSQSNYGKPPQRPTSAQANQGGQNTGNNLAKAGSGRRAATGGSTAAKVGTGAATGGAATATQAAIAASSAAAAKVKEAMHEATPDVPESRS